MSFQNNEHFATNVYYDRTFDCEAAKILPGEYYYTNDHYQTFRRILE